MALNSRNDCPNPYAATATTGATSSATGGTVPITRVTGLTSPWLKSTAFRTTRTGAGTFDYQLITPMTSDQGDVGGQSWSGTIQWAVSATGVPVNINFLAFNASGTYVGVIQSISVSSYSANTPQETKVTGTTPSGTRRIGMAVYVTSGPVNHAITLTAIRLDSVSNSNLAYSDGATSGWLWEGTAGDSTSIQPIAKTSSDSAVTSESFNESTNNTQPALYGNAWDWEPSGVVADSNFNYPADSGPNVLQYVKDGLTSYATTANNRMEVVWATGDASTSQAVYLDQPTPSVIKYMTATFGWGPGTDNAQASIVIASWDLNHPTPPVKAQIHLAISRSAWFYHIVDTLSGITLLKQGTFASAMIADWRRYTASVTVSGNTASLTFPDGTTDTVTDSRIGSFQGTTNCFEFYRTNNTYTANIACYRFYAGPGSGNPLARDNATLSDASLLDTAGGNKLGTDAATLIEQAAVFAAVSRTDAPGLLEATTTSAALVRSDGASAGEQSMGPATYAPASDLASLNESTSIFQGLLKTSSDLASFSDLAQINAYITRSDIAASTDTHQEYSSFYRSDLHAVTDQLASQNILSSDLLSFYENVNPRLNSLYTQDLFTAYDLGEGNFPRFLSDLFDFNEQAVVFERERVTEDPFYYPRSYYGSSRTRVIAQDHFTREFLHWDLPVDGLELTFSLSGPNLLRGKLSTELESITTLKQKLEPYRTWLHVEDDGYIIASFILTPFIDNPQEQTRGIEGEGFSSYPHSVYWEDNQYIGIQVDPADMIRKLWDHVQSYTDGNLYAKVWSTTTPVRIGYPTNSVQFTSKEGNEVSIQGEPYNLNFWSVINCGEEINRLCQETPIEYWEFSIWNEFKNDVEHYIVLGYPRVGSKRQDLVFREGENLVQLVPSYQEAQENYASDVFVIGAGQGPGAVRVKHSERIGRLRRTHVIQDQQISNKERAQAIADFEFKRLSKSRYLIENITVDTTHTNARWGSFIAGDDIYLQCTVPYVGLVQAWYRITEYVYDPYQHIATLTLVPSESFTYGATNYNPYADIPHEGFAVLSDADFDISDQSDEDSVRQLNIKLCQQAGVEAFNKNNVKNGFAYAYMQLGTTTNYTMRQVPIEQVIDPYFIIIGRTQDGYLITGENVYVVASDGSIGQPPDSQNETANPSAPPAGNYTATAHAPFPVGLQLAAREYYNAFTSNMYISPELSYMGISANAESWRSTIGYLYYTVYGKQYNYAIKSPGGDFSFMVSNISNNVGFMT